MGVMRWTKMTDVVRMDAAARRLSACAMVGWLDTAAHEWGKQLCQCSTFMFRAPSVITLARARTYPTGNCLSGRIGFYARIGGRRLPVMNLRPIVGCLLHFP